VLVAASGTTAGLGPLLKALGATPEAPGLYLVDPRMRAVAVIPLRQAPAAVGRDVAALMSADLDRL
jgi:hypothetical protein